MDRNSSALLCVALGLIFRPVVLPGEAKDAREQTGAPTVSVQRFGVRLTATITPPAPDINEQIWVRISFENNSPDLSCETLSCEGLPAVLGFEEVALLAEATGRPVPYTEKGKELCDPFIRWNPMKSPLFAHSRPRRAQVSVAPGAEIRQRWDFELTELFECHSPGRYSLVLSRSVNQAGKSFVLKLPPLNFDVADRLLQKAEREAAWSKPALGVEGKAFVIVEVEENLPTVHVYAILRNVSHDRSPAIEYGGKPALELWDLRWQAPSMQEPIPMHEVFRLIPAYDDDKIYWLDHLTPGAEQRFHFGLSRLDWKEKGTHRLFLARRVFWRPDGQYNREREDPQHQKRLDFGPVEFKVRDFPTDIPRVKAQE